MAKHSATRLQKKPFMARYTQPGLIVALCSVSFPAYAFITITIWDLTALAFMLLWPFFLLGLIIALAMMWKTRHTRRGTIIAIQAGAVVGSLIALIIYSESF